MKLFKKLKNKYFVLRHGESNANVLEIILSHLEHGTNEEFTLTKNGEKQVINSVKKAKADGLLNGEIIIYSSPFSRCKRTAEIAKEILEVKDKIHFDERLRERWFGNFERMHNSNYQKVWNIDTDNPNHKNFNVESVQEVQERTVSLIIDLEKKYQNRNILLVSHGDVLQIMQTWFYKVSSSLHRSLKHLETAEIRSLYLK